MTVIEELGSLRRRVTQYERLIFVLVVISLLATGLIGLSWYYSYTQNHERRAEGRYNCTTAAERTERFNSAIHQLIIVERSTSMAPLEVREARIKAYSAALLSVPDCTLVGH